VFSIFILTSLLPLKLQKWKRSYKSKEPPLYMIQDVLALVMCCVRLKRLRRRRNHPIVTALHQPIQIITVHPLPLQRNM
jgi:hypothetical protein